MNKYVSIDIGGTAIKYGIIYEDAEIICKRSMKTEAWKGGPAILQKVTGIVEEMKQEAQEEISGICISTAVCWPCREPFWCSKRSKNSTGIDDWYWNWRLYCD